MIVGAEPTQRVGQGVLSATLLPSGRYVARARITRDGKIAGVLVRPFILDLPPAGTAMPSPFTQGTVAKFDPKLPLSPRVLGEFLGLAEKQFPELKGPLAEARAGRFGIAAIEALTSGDQTAAAFFKGLDWYSKGQLNQAVTQLELASGPRREFFPAAFYLGAVFAAAGRDRDAAGVWQIASGKEPRPALFYLLLSDARLRDGQPASVVDVLKPAYDRSPTDEEILRRLMSAYLMLGRYEEALPILDAYLVKYPADELANFAAVFAQYQVSTRERLVVTAAQQAKLARYVRNYDGPYEALLAKYLQSIRGR
jgi:tetratricopeptide (TPR) repeat protein